jgi:hypothetical protein
MIAPGMQVFEQGKLAETWLLSVQDPAGTLEWLAAE